MNKKSLAFLLVGFFLIIVGDIISFQTNQAAVFISTLSSDIGLLIAFLQFFVPFPLFPLSASHTSQQNSGRTTSAPKTSPPFSRGACFALIARGICFLLLGVIGSISALVITFAGNPYVIQLLTSVGGGIVFLSGMVTLLIASEEWAVPRRRRWFLLEGIFGSLAGWSFVSASAAGPLISPTLLEGILLTFSLLFFALWIITTGFGEIRASNGWALTAGGVLTFGEIGAIAGYLTGNGVMAFLALFCYPMLFGVTSILGASKDRRGGSVRGPSIPPLSQSPQPSQKKRFLVLAAVWLIIVGGTFFYSMTRIGEAQVASTILAQQVGDPYGGSLLISDPMSESGSAFGWDNGNDNNSNECNFKDGGYHVSGSCLSEAAIPPKFAFEIVLTTSQSCGGINLELNNGNDDFLIGVCQNGAYSLYAYSDSGSDSSSGSASSMNTATGQSNLVGIVADGTDITLYINQVKVASVSDTAPGTGNGLLYIEGLDANAALLNNANINSPDDREVVYANALLWSL